MAHSVQHWDEAPTMPLCSDFGGHMSFPRIMTLSFYIYIQPRVLNSYLGLGLLSWVLAYYLGLGPLPWVLAYYLGQGPLSWVLAYYLAQGPLPCPGCWPIICPNVTMIIHL